jgi:copper chaperone CopZ
MKTKTFEIPTLYGDHHVLEVRRILFAIPGVKDVYASSAFQTVEVIYDENLTNDLDIAVKLDESGYLGEWSIPVEIGATAPSGNGKKAFFRHTEVYEATRHVVSFAQSVHDAPKPLWPCPGMGVIKKMEDE